MAKTHTLTTKNVAHVAKLAKLTLTEDEIVKFQNQLSEIMSYVEELNEVNTDSVLPTSQTTGLENVTRMDSVISEHILTPQSAVSGTENTVNNYFVVDLTLTERSL